MSGRLVLVATPIGNLSDISARALDALRSADVIACEDTRHSRKLLTHFDIGNKRLIAMHEHNERRSTDEVIELIKAGNVVALVSDAGMPTISDPGQMVVAAAAAEALEVTAVPGASAVITALALSGLPTDRFSFEGFPARKPGERRREFEALACDRRTMVFYESPHRVAATLADMASVFGSDRRVALVRELTKIHEEVVRSTTSALAAKLEGQTVKGECVLVVEGAPVVEVVTSDAELVSMLRQRLSEGLTKKDAVARVVEETGAPKKAVYALATSL